MRHFRILIVLLALGLCMANVRSQAASNVSLEEIDLGLSGQTLKEWYEAQTAHTGDAAYFGAYVTLPVADTLYIGLGSARPAEDSGDGAYFASFDGATLAGIAEPDEQGLHEMIYDGSLVHIAGTDPHNGDDWRAGNHYTYDPDSDTFTKYRDATNGLVDVIHTWGLWKSDSTVYAAVSAHAGDNTTYMGQIFSSADNGATWQHLSDLGGYRAYDIIGFDGDLHAIHNDALGGELSLSKSTDGGYAWNPVTGLAGNVRRVHMLEFNGQLLAASWDRGALYALDTGDNVTSHALPSGYLVGATYDDVPAYADYHVMAVAKGYLYLIVENESSSEVAILRTADLNNWEQMVHTGEKLISLSYWSDRDWLVTATPGTNAKLWKVDLAGTPTAVRLASFTATPLGQVVLVTWETAGELDNLGFHLYRAEGPDGEPGRLNETLIPGQSPGSSLGGRYTFLDQAVSPNVTYAYWLEAVDVHGAGVRHGPVTVTLETQPNAVILGSFRARIAHPELGAILLGLGMALALAALWLLRPFVVVWAQSQEPRICGMHGSDDTGREPGIRSYCTSVVQSHRNFLRKL